MLQQIGFLRPLNLQNTFYANIILWRGFPFVQIESPVKLTSKVKSTGFIYDECKYHGPTLPVLS